VDRVMQVPSCINIPYVWGCSWLGIAGGSYCSMRQDAWLPPGSESDNRQRARGRLAFRRVETAGAPLTR